MAPDDAWLRRELAASLLAQRRFDEALAEAEVARGIEPNQPDSHLLLARIEVQAGRTKEAHESFRTTLRLAVDTSGALEGWIDSCPTFEEKRAALAFFREQLIQQVVFGDALLAYRAAAFSVLDPPELLTALREAFAARPDLWHAGNALIGQLIDMQHTGEALALAKQCAERFPLVPGAWSDLATAHHHAGEYEREIEALRRARQLNPAWSHVSRRLSEVHERLSQPDEARQVLEQAIAAAPLDAVNHGMLADLLMRRGEREAACERLAQAIRIAPGYNWAWSSLRHWSLEFLGENRAAALARELTQSRPGEGRSWYFLAQSLDDSELPERLAALKKATELNPRFEDAYDLWAELLAREGRFDEALAVVSPAVFQDQPSAPLQGRAAWVEAARGNRRAAVARMRKTLESFPDYYWGWERLTDWLCADRDFAGARAAAEKMVRLAPRSAVPLGYLADIERKMGNEEKAWQTLERAFEVDPAYEFAGYLLFDRCLGKREHAQAQGILQRLAQHCPGPRLAAAQVRLACALSDKSAAKLHLRGLCLSPASGAAALREAVHAMYRAAWTRAVEDSLSEQLQNPRANPEVGALWAGLIASRRAWRLRKRLYRLDVSQSVGRRAHIAWIEALGEHGQSSLLRRYLRRFPQWTSHDAEAWGTVAFALVRLGEFKKATKWTDGWQLRQGTTPWMIFNRMIALRMLDRPDDAAETNRLALELKPDHTTPLHRVWFAWHLALRGESGPARSHLAEVSEAGLEERNVFLLRITEALLAVSSAPPEERKAVYSRSKQDLKMHKLRGAWADGMIGKSYRLSLIAMAKAAGVRRSWWSELCERFRGRVSYLHGSVFAVMAICSLLPTCARLLTPNRTDRKSKFLTPPNVLAKATPRATPRPTPDLKKPFEPERLRLERGVPGNR
jgi:tetratricopeptide (TPR) repeat protein